MGNVSGMGLHDGDASLKRSEAGSGALVQMDSFFYVYMSGIGSGAMQEDKLQTGL